MKYFKMVALLAYEIVLFREADTPIQRHIKIKADANPHDPKWARYFESRWGKKMLNSSRGRMKLYRLWLKQDRLCPYCQKPIKQNTPWETRFRLKRADGGTNASSNLIMCHLYCQEPHLNADKVVKPGAERCLKRGLSRMRGNSQVRFLGEKKAVMPFSYPTEYALIPNCSKRSSDTI